jgi:hypothetical protein
VSSESGVGRGGEGEDGCGNVDDVIAPSLSPVLRSTGLVERSRGDPALLDEVIGGAVGQVGEQACEGPPLTADDDGATAGVDPVEVGAGLPLSRLARTTAAKSRVRAAPA